MLLWSTPDFAELPADYDGLYYGSHPVVVPLEPDHQFVEEGFVRKLNFAAEGIAEEFAAEVADKGVTAFLQQVGAQTIESANWATRRWKSIRNLVLSAMKAMKLPEPQILV